jgi:hypothetical protein
METDIKPSYWFAGLSTLGLLTALALTIVNVSNAQQDMPQLWATVAGQVTFNDDYSQILDMASDALIVIEERNGKESKKIKFSLFNRGVSPGRTRVELKEFNKTIAYEYTVNGKPEVFDENTQAWFEEAYTNTIQNLYLQTPVENRMFLSQANDTNNGYKVYLIAIPNEIFNNTYINASTMQWNKQPTEEELQEMFLNDLIYKQYRYSSGSIKRSRLRRLFGWCNRSPRFS